MLFCASLATAVCVVELSLSRRGKHQRRRIPCLLHCLAKAISKRDVADLKIAGIGRTIRVILDLLTVKFLLSYSTRPLHIFGLIGGTMGLVGLLITGWLAYWRLMGAMSLNQHQPLLLLGIILMFTGVQLVTVGLLAEMQARTYHESQNKPTYVIREVRQSTVNGHSVMAKG